MNDLLTSKEHSNEKIIEKINRAMGLKVNCKKSKLPFYLLVSFLLVFILVMIIIRR